MANPTDYDVVLKKGQKLLIEGETLGYDEKRNKWLYAPPREVRISSIKNQGTDWEVIRVMDDKASWRLDRGTILKIR